MALDFAAYTPNEFRLRTAARLARMTPAASSESCLLGRFRLNEEKNLFRVRPARWARRPAINSRRADRIDERALHSRIMQSDRCKASPARERWKRGRQWAGIRRHGRCAPSQTQYLKSFRERYPNLAVKLIWPGSRLTRREKRREWFPREYAVGQLRREPELTR